MASEALDFDISDEAVAEISADLAADLIDNRRELLAAEWHLEQLPDSPLTQLLRDWQRDALAATEMILEEL
jgi:hypothetical protein